ncbi:MAG: proton-conducting transporter membrane subunit, partial [bacterium]|nr:proton-conducting transporter membrane subunit [bacterium]
MININWLQFAGLISPWGIPLAAGLLILLICPFLKNHHRFSFGISLASLFISLWLACQYWMGAKETVIGSLLFDKISYFFVILFLIAAILVILLSYHFLETFGINRPEFYALILFCVFGMGCMAAGSDLMVIFLGLEIMSVSLYILAGFHRTNIFSIEASLKYFLVGAFASS